MIFLQSMSQQSEILAVPALMWLGVHPNDIKELNIEGVQLTDEDVRSLVSLRERPYVASNPEILAQVNTLFPFFKY